MRRKPPALDRRASTRQPTACLVIFCEGKKTEPDYLRRFAEENGNKLVKLVIHPAAGEPGKLVESALEAHRHYEQLALAGDSYELYEVWAVFDRDIHDRYEEALAIARRNKLRVAMSNPCFELWGILHFSDHDGEYTHREVQKMLKKHMGSYDNKKEKVFDYVLMKDHYPAAVKRAKTLQRNRNAERNPEGNPSTRIYYLLERIVALGKQSYKR